MKKFAFPLERVLQWRDAQARIEQSKLEGLYAELRAIDSRQAKLRRDAAQAGEGLLAAQQVTGADLAAFASFRRFAAAEHARLEVSRADCASRIAAQLQLAAARRRDVRLLERLKDRRFKTWRKELQGEVDAEADEAFLGRHPCADGP